MSRAVRLLLFLSALMSALTGAGAQARAPQVAVAVAQVAEAAACETAQDTIAASRPLSAPRAPLVLSPAPVAPIASVVPSFGERRRE
jgi:hypothetical protein